MPQLSRLFSIIALTLLLSACSQTLERKTCVALASDVSYCLAPVVDSLPQQQTVSASQKATIRTQTQQHELLTQLELTQQNLTLVGLAPLGQALFTLTFDGKTLISEQSSFMGDQFKAEYLLAIMQLIYWPDASVNRHLQGAVMRSYQCDADLCRGVFADNKNNIDSQISNKHQPMIAIRYRASDNSQLDKWQADVELSIQAAKFTLNISPI